MSLLNFKCSSRSNSRITTAMVNQLVLIWNHTISFVELEGNCDDAEKLYLLAHNLKLSLLSVYLTLAKIFSSVEVN